VAGGGRSPARAAAPDGRRHRRNPGRPASRGHRRSDPFPTSIPPLRRQAGGPCGSVVRGGEPRSSRSHVDDARLVLWTAPTLRSPPTASAEPHGSWSRASWRRGAAGVTAGSSSAWKRGCVGAFVSRRPRSRGPPADRAACRSATCCLPLPGPLLGAQFLPESTQGRRVPYPHCRVMRGGAVSVVRMPLEISGPRPRTPSRAVFVVPRSDGGAG
jgi:hypothetical protein